MSTPGISGGLILSILALPYSSPRCTFLHGLKVGSHSAHDGRPASVCTMRWGKIALTLGKSVLKITKFYKVEMPPDGDFVT